MPEELIELFSSKDLSAIRQTKNVLEEANIPHNLIGGENGFDIASIGSEEDSENSINVKKSDYDRARRALEEDSLKTDIPTNHHLNHSSNEDLFEILSHASEWSPFDVAHARRLLTEKGIDITKLEEDRQEQITRLEKGSPASKKLIFFGWFFCLLGGLFGVAIGLSLSQMKNKTPVGEFYRYDEGSRRNGERMFKLGLSILIIGLIIRFAL